VNILIIGGTGQISRAITRQFLETGNTVTIFHRGHTLVQGLERVQTILGDRRDFQTFERQMSETNPFDCVIDMVCYTPQEAESLVRAFRGRIGQLILCSSAAVYQRPASRYPVTEKEPLLPTSSYGRDKARCEQILFNAHERGDFGTTILRPANTYGPGGDLVYTLNLGSGFLDRIRKGKPLVSPGDGCALRAYAHAEDVARGFVAAAGNFRAYGQAYHLTGEEWLAWDSYFELIAAALEAPLPRLVHIPCEVLYAMAPDRLSTVMENYRFNNIFDNQAARIDLDYRYTIKFTDGIRQTIGWMEANGCIQNSDDDPFDDVVIAAWDQRQTGFPLKD
jgi:nucleoside-diphosphate-sugar epimerase